MRKHVLTIFMFAAMLSFVSCGNKSEQTVSGNENDSTAVSETLDVAEVEEMTAFINSVSGCLDSIQVQEKMIFSSEEGVSDKQKMLIQLRSFKELLARKQDEIKSLTDKNSKLSSSSKKTIANLQKMVEFLNAELADKTKKIAELEDLIQKKDVSIDELRYSVKELSNETDYLKEQNYQQDKAMNTRYYIVGTNKELKSKGLLKGGFLKKSKVDNSGIDKSLFKSVDVRSFKSLTLQSKKPKLMSGNPEGSYTIKENEDGTSTLSITNPDKFWTASDFLIIQL